MKLGDTCRKRPFSALATNAKCSWGTSCYGERLRESSEDAALVMRINQVKRTTPDPYKLSVVKANMDLYSHRIIQNIASVLISFVSKKWYCAIFPCYCTETAGDWICSRMPEYRWPPAALYLCPIAPILCLQSPRSQWLVFVQQKQTEVEQRATLLEPLLLQKLHIILCASAEWGCVCSWTLRQVQQIIIQC